MRKLKVISQYRKDAKECSDAGFTFFAEVNTEMADLLQKDIDDAKRDAARNGYGGVSQFVDFDNVRFTELSGSRTGRMVSTESPLTANRPRSR